MSSGAIGWVLAGTAGTTEPLGGSGPVLLGLLAILVLAVYSVRVVTEHERVVVCRLGRVSRVAGPGLAFRLPLLERLTTVSLRPAHLHLVATAVTKDGVPVRVVGTGVYQVTEPFRATAADPDVPSATAAELESSLAKEVGRHDLVDLLPGREEITVRLPREVSRTTSAWGVDVIEIEVSDIETRLTADLLRSAMQLPRAGDGERV